MEYKFSNGCRPISRGGERFPEYEECHRTMVIAGMKWLDEHPEAKLQFTFQGCNADLNDLSELQEAMLNSINGDSTLIMMQVSIKEIIKAKYFGWEKYIKALEEEKQKVWN